jgi:hypothetical protein
MKKAAILGEHVFGKCAGAAVDADDRSMQAVAAEPWRQKSHAPHAQLISAVARLPTHAGSSACSTTPINSWPRMPLNPGTYPRVISISVLAGRFFPRPLRRGSVKDALDSSTSTFGSAELSVAAALADCTNCC